MNRNDITGILTGLELTDAQVKGLLDLNSGASTTALLSDMLTPYCATN